MNKPAHYLRFVQAIVLAAAVPACSGSSDEPSTETAPSPPATSSAASSSDEPPSSSGEESADPPTPDTSEKVAPFTAEADAGSDAELPRTSGPLMPPVFA